MGWNNTTSVAYGQPFVIVERYWISDWDPARGPEPEQEVKYEYGVSFYFTGLLKNAAIIGALALTGWFLLWPKIRPGGPTWSKVGCRVYLLAALSLLTINVWFAIAHQAYAHDSLPGPYIFGWPVPVWTDMFGDMDYMKGMFALADIYNGLIVFIVPLLMAIASEKILSRRNMRHNQRIHQTPKGAGDP